MAAAIEVFAKNGFYATRVSEIAKAAGVADGTIYLYFKNKDDVLISIFEEGIERLLESLRGVAASEEPAEAKIRHVLDLQLGLGLDRRAHRGRASPSLSLAFLAAHPESRSIHNL